MATLFDFNGVLVDDEHVHLAAFREVLAPRGVGVDDAAYNERYLGFDDAGAFHAMLEDAGQTVEDGVITGLIDAKKAVYRARIEHGLRIFPGAIELVRRRAARGLVGVVSGALRDEIVFGLERMDVASCVAFIVAAEDARACKPDPEGYVRAIAEVRRRGDDTRIVALEDSLAGVRGAKSAGLRCVAVTASYTAAELWDAGADAVVDGLGALDDATFDGDG